MSELFSMLDFAGEEPTYAVGCMYCHLDIDTGEGQGTTVSLEIPIARPANTEGGKKVA